MLEAGVPIRGGYTLRGILSADAKGLLRFYRGLSAESRRRLTPVGFLMDRGSCELICFDNEITGDKHDLVLLLDERIVGWCFVWGVHGPRPSIGLAIADGHQRRGLGSMMLQSLVEWARGKGLMALYLTVERDHAAARGLYEHAGFQEVDGAGGGRYCAMSLVLCGGPGH